LVPVDLIVDHSVQVDYFGASDALTKNVAKEYERNSERYALLKWAQKSFDNFNGEPVYLKDIWPASIEIWDLANQHVVKPQFFRSEYDKIFDGDEFWQKLQVTESTTFRWDKNSTYIKRTPYFDGFNLQTAPSGDIRDAKTLVLMGDSITTDHISPAGAIP
jgi:aconitase A